MLKYLDTTEVFIQQDGGTVYILSLECNYKNVRSWESEVCLCAVRTVNNDTTVFVRNLKVILYTHFARSRDLSSVFLPPSTLHLERFYGREQCVSIKYRFHIWCS